MAVNFRLIFYTSGWLILILAASMLVPVIPALVYRDGTAADFLISAAITGLSGLIFVAQGYKHRPTQVRNREGLAIVGLAWLMIGLFGALPFWVSGTAPDFWSGVFESFSGFSATGATNFPDMEALAPSVHFWRLLSQWLGGMGVIVLMVAILPFLGVGGVQLFKNEFPGFAFDKLRPRITETAKFLWSIYVGLTVVMTVLLMLGGVGLFDSICHTFSAMATGGFSTRNASVGHFESAYVDFVVVAFMFICSMNFALYYQLLHGNWQALFKNVEARVFTAITFIGIVLVTLTLWLNNVYPDLFSTVRYGTFQVVSLVTTTALATADWGQWPHFSQAVLFLMFLVGGCAGSTSGGLKCIRWILLFKGVSRALKQYIHPKAVIQVRVGGKVVPEEVMSGVWALFMMYIITMLITTLCLTSMDMDPMTAFTATISSLSNIGPCLGEAIGPSGNYAGIPGPAKGLLSFCMFLGRLEFFTIMVLFLPDFWRK